MTPATTATSAAVSPPAGTTLGVLLDQAGDRPLVVRLGTPTVDAVVLRRRGDALVEVMLAPSGKTTTLPADQTAQTVSDPGLRAEPLGQALAEILGHIHRLNTQLGIQREGHAARLGAIRDYAIARYADGQICKKGLNTFLQAFDLEPYEPELRVRFTITGSYLVRGCQPDEARYDARNHLDVYLADLDDAVEDSADLDIHVDDVTELPHH
jgi:hypothetical protein